MPTRAELPRSNNSYQETYSWTDDLPVCRHSGKVYVVDNAGGKNNAMCVHLPW